MMAWIVEYKRQVMQGAVAAGLLGLSAFGVAQSLPAEAHYGSDKASPSKQSQPDAGDPAKGGGDTLDAATYLGVQRLRGELCMGQGDLAAMGCDTATATTLIEGLITTHETRRGDVIAARNTVLATKTALRRAQREELSGDGEPDIASLRTLATDYDDAVEAYQLLLESLAQGMSIGLTDDQKALWSAARASERDGRPPELRYAVDLTEGQLEDIRTPGSDARGNPRSPVEAADLRLMQEASIEQARANRAAHARAVVLAEEEALPVPPELVEDDAGRLVDEEALRDIE